MSLQATNSISPKNPVPTPPLLTDILLKKGVIERDRFVEDVIESEDGKMGKGNIVAYNIRYNITEEKTENQTNLPNTIIVKHSVSGDESDNTLDKGALLNIDNKCFRFLPIAREAWFMQEFSEQTFSQPKVFHTIADFKEPQGMVILMEDLRSSTTRMDQFHGAQGGLHLERQGHSSNETLSSKEAWKLVFEDVATTHAKYWGVTNLTSDARTKLKYTSWMNGESREEWEASLMACRLAWNKVDKSSMSKRVITFITTCLERATFDRAAKRMNNRPKTLVHGDFHAKNIFWNDNRRRVTMIDFSEVGIGNPMCDLGQYVISDVETEVRRIHEEEVLRAYWDKLTSSGVDPNEYPFTQCWESYKQDGLDRFVWFFPVLSYFGWAPKFFHDQIDGFLKDHNVNAEEFVLTFGIEMLVKTQK